MYQDMPRSWLEVSLTLWKLMVRYLIRAIASEEDNTS